MTTYHAHKNTVGRRPQITIGQYSVYGCLLSHKIDESANKQFLTTAFTSVEEGSHHLEFQGWDCRGSYDFQVGILTSWGIAVKISAEELGNSNF